MNKRESLRCLALLICSIFGLLATAGCVSVPGSNVPATTWYLLEDPTQKVLTGHPAGDVSDKAAKPGGEGLLGAPSDLVLLIGPVSASAFDDSLMLSYGRTPQTRAHYQFAGWTERPPRRLGLLVERRLESMGKFAGVVQSTAGVQAQLLLNLHLEHLFHDLSGATGQARIAIDAELVDWRNKRLLGHRRFHAGRPVSTEDAAAAVAALNLALGDVLDQLAPWVEQSATRRSKGSN